MPRTDFTIRITTDLPSSVDLYQILERLLRADPRILEAEVVCEQDSP